MQDKKIIALIVLSLGAIASLIYGVTASPKSKYRSPASAQPQAVVAAKPQGTGNVAASERRYRRSQFKSWSRNPFTLNQSSSDKGLALNGIIWNKTKPKAMIGDAMVSEGDIIDTNRVVDIQPDKVILNDGTKDFELKIEK